MTQNLKYSLAANTTRVGVNHSTNQTFNFSTGAACANNGACIMNGNTVMTEQIADGGYYYSWYAATAGTGTSSMASGDAAGSICPKGWRLPANYTSSTTKSYGALMREYIGSSGYIAGNYISILEDSPLNFHRNGYYDDAVLRNKNISGPSWSNTASTQEYGYFFNYTTNAVESQRTYAKYCGFSIRCMNI